MKKAHGSLVVIEGLDGSGKSTTAQDAAQSLSEAYPASAVGVADSTGLYSYRNGALVDHRYRRLIELEPEAEDGKLKTLGSLGAFTVGRKLVDYQGLRRSDLLISVRDPQRVDPAVYSAVYSPTTFGRLSPAARLQFFDRFSRSAYPDSIIQLVTDTDQSRANTLDREVLCPHESAEKMQILAEELPMVLSAFTRLYGSPVHEVQGLHTSTAADTASVIEPLLPRPPRIAV